MGTPGWDSVTWEGFVAALRVYKGQLSGKSRQDSAYVQALGALQGRGMSERADRAGEIVTFLNRWACRVSRTETPAMLGAWISEHWDRLDRLSGAHIADAELPVDEIHELYESLMTSGRAKVRNWSDAANSKALHQLIPSLFVMWDKDVKRFALGYGDFTAKMHRLARRIVVASPYVSDQLETALQRALDYPVRKPLAKYLDEFNIVRTSGINRGASGRAVP